MGPNPTVLEVPAGLASLPLDEALERGQILYYPCCPFPLPQGEGHAFLLRQELRRLTHKNISYNPATGRLTGHQRTGGGQRQRLRALFAAFSEGVTAWLRHALPRYAAGLERDRASYRPDEEATRRLRHSARNDLLHIDAFPNRPSRGRRLLRVYANVNPTEPRVWATSEAFPQLLARYGAAAGLQGQAVSSWLGQLGQGMLALFGQGPARRPAYDAFMLRLHDFLKTCDEFQERSPKRVWSFAPGSAWLVFTDSRSHAELRGRFALEHSFFVERRVLALPDEAPAALLERACAGPGAGRAA
jgi:hypothetical protein